MDDEINIYVSLGVPNLYKLTVNKNIFWKDIISKLNNELLLLLNCNNNEYNIVKYIISNDILYHKNNNEINNLNENDKIYAIIDYNSEYENELFTLLFANYLIIDNIIISDLSIEIINDEEETTNILNEEQISKIKKIKYSEINDIIYDVCPISNEKFSNDDDIYLLNCGHYFSDNLINWVENYSNVCPYCRNNINNIST